MFLLPSKGYGIDDLPDRIHVENGSLKFLRLTSRSVAEDDYAPFIDAMQSLIPTLDINTLSLPDFYGLVMHARIKLFPSSPITYNHVCRNTVFDTELGTLDANGVKKAVAESKIDKGTRLNPRRCGMQFKTIVESPKNLETVYFDPTGFDTTRFALPRVELLAEYRRLIKDPELRFIVPQVVWLKDGETIEEKMQIIEASDNAMDLVDELSKVAINYGFGVRNRLVNECPDCGKETELPVHIDNQSFLRM